jgi:Ca2+-transporting ATPase
MVGIVAVTFMIQMLITQYGGVAFKTQPLELEIWMHLLIYTFSVVIFNELIKLLMRIGYFWVPLQKIQQNNKSVSNK